MYLFLSIIESVSNCRNVTAVTHSCLQERLEGGPVSWLLAVIQHLSVCVGHH